MGSPATRIAVAAAALMAAACFDPNLGNTPFTCPSGECPPGYQCHPQTHECVQELVTIDAPMGPDASADAPRQDGRPADAPARDAPSPDALLPDGPPPPLVDLTVIARGPGDLGVSPAGTSCGVDCHRYTAGTIVTITAFPDDGLSVAAWTGGGCQDAGDGPCVVTVLVDTIVIVDFCPVHYVVDPSGSDNGDGTCRDPLRTITEALGRAQSGQFIKVNPGTYDKTSGETFPLVVGSGVTVLGDEAAKGRGFIATRVIGGGSLSGGEGTATVVVLSGTLAGFWITNDNLDATTTEGVALYLSGNVLRNNTVSACGDDGVAVLASDSAIVGNVLVDNGNAGLVFFSPTATDAPSRVEGNLVARNNYGVALETILGDLGGGGAGSAGGNLLGCNVFNDVWTNDPGKVFARDNYWDHVPPSSGCFALGLDFCSTNGMATLDAAGALLSPGPCP